VISFECVVRCLQSCWSSHVGLHSLQPISQLSVHCRTRRRTTTGSTDSRMSSISEARARLHCSANPSDSRREGCGTAHCSRIDTRCSRFGRASDRPGCFPYLEMNQPLLNRLYLRRGRYIEAGKPDEILVSESFADANHLQAGATIGPVINGTWRRF